ncbi:MAG: hypothetical protein AVDCRST_MAG73-1020, partial [uncultured Thermomicrobiales bacterium]
MARPPVRPLALVLALLALFVAPASSLAQDATPAAPRYTVTDLGTLGGPSSSAHEINAHGDVVGYSAVLADAATPTGAGDAPRTDHAFLWRDGAMVDLGTFGGRSSDTTGINDAGQVAVDAEMEDGATRSFLWEDGAATDLGTLGGAHAWAIELNDAGQVVGFSTTAPGQELLGPGTHAFLWENGTMTDLGTLGGAWSRASDVNEAGQVFGTSE